LLVDTPLDIETMNITITNALQLRLITLIWDEATTIKHQGQWQPSKRARGRNITQ